MTSETPVEPRPHTAGPVRDDRPAHPEPGDALADAGGAPPTGWGRSDQVLLNVFVVLLVLTQRIGIPTSDTAISASVPLAYVLIAVLALRGSLRFSRIRVELLLVALTAVVAVTFLAEQRGANPSVPSLQLLAVIYLPWVVQARTVDGFAVAASAGRTFVRTMLVLAAVGVLELGSQLAGIWTWQDYLQEWLPSKYIVPNYNFGNPLEFGSDITKGDGLVLLEPSFLSQFCALALIIGLLLHVRAWQIVLLIAGVASSVSGTGIILLVAGTVLLLVRARRAVRLRYVLAGAVALGLVLWSPVSAQLLNRSSELSQTQSSGYSRFVAPYQQVLQGLADDPIRYLLGAGAGTAESLHRTNAVGFGRDVLYSTLPKLAFEYGVLAGGLFCIFLVVANLRGSPWRVVPGALLFMTFFLSGALLQPQTAFLVWVLAILGARDDVPADAEVDDAGMPDPHPA
jgi:hypothetical protein